MSCLRIDSYYKRLLFNMATISSISEEDQQESQQERKERLPSTEDVLCDSCIDTPSRALKSCLTCLVSYCNSHLRPHLENGKFQSHRLVEPLHDIDCHTCDVHRLPFDRFCLTDSSCLCQDCEREVHDGHTTASAEEARAKIKVFQTNTSGFLQSKSVLCHCFLLT